MLEKRRLWSLHSLLFSSTPKKTVSNSFPERKDSSGENTAVPGEHGIFILIHFSTHGVLYTVFCDM